MPRTFGETKDCAGCRFWSEMIAMANDDRGLQAMCLSSDGPLARKYTVGVQTCTEWKSGHLGAIDQPPDYGEETREQYDMEATKVYSNGQRMFTDGGTMLDEHGNRSIFDDLDE